MKFTKHKKGASIQKGDVGRMSNGDFIPVAASMVGAKYKPDGKGPIGRLQREPNKNGANT